MPTAPAIYVESLQKTYVDGLFRKRRVLALKDVSFQVERGSIFGLLGPNGAGKTTLIKILLGLVRRTGGDATLLGRSAGDREGRAKVGYLPEHHRIPRHLTGNSALQYYGGLSGLAPGIVRERRQELLNRVGLSDWGRVSVKKYSKGMLQRLGLAQAMLHDPDLLILDEPTDGVDPVGRREMRSLLQELKDEGRTVFINSHLLQEVELVCDRVAILVEGTLRRVGTVEEITTRHEPDVELGLSGDESSIREALTAFEITSWNAGSDRQFDVQVQADSQEAVNRCVDDLRRHGIGIVQLRRTRDSLEDAFLNVVTSGDNSDLDDDTAE